MSPQARQCAFLNTKLLVTVADGGSVELQEIHHDGLALKGAFNLSGFMQFVPHMEAAY